MTSATEGRQLSPIQEVRGALTNMAGEFTSALPSHIKPEQFQRVAMTAIQNNPELLNADRQSLFGSVMKAAQDGLLPDGREGALIIFKTKDRQTQQWLKKVQWMPMIGGVLKKIRQSGELASITSQIVYGADQFDYWIDDDGEHLQHRPSFGDERGPVRLVYALAKTKDNSVYIEVMTVADVEKVRGASKSKDRGPWVDWWEQMAKKSAMHRLAKRLPISADLMEVVNRDEALYDFAPKERDITPEKPVTPSQAAMITKLVDQCSGATREWFEEKYGDATAVPKADYDRLMASLRKRAQQPQEIEHADAES